MKDTLGNQGWVWVIIGLAIIIFAVSSKNEVVTDKLIQEVEVVPEARYTLEKLYDAIRFVESTNGQRIHGENGEIGDYQLKKIYVDDVNRIQRLIGYEGEELYMSYNDRYDTVKSRRATAILTSYYANYSWRYRPHTAKQYIETAARSHHRPTDRHNSKTDAYWEKVKARMGKINE